MKLKKAAVGFGAGLAALLCIAIAETNTSTSQPPAEQRQTMDRSGNMDQSAMADPNQSRFGGRSRGSRRGMGGMDLSSVSQEERQQMMESARNMGFDLSAFQGGGGPGGGMGGGPGGGFGGGMGGGFGNFISTNDPNAMESLTLNNTEMRNIIKTIGDWTGKTVIPATDEVMQVRVTLYSPQRIKRTQALGLLYMALYARGIAVEQNEDRIILRTLATAKLGAIPMLGVDEPLARVEDKTSIVEKWFQLISYKPSSLVEMIRPLIGEHGYAMADENSGRIGIIDSVENLERIEKLIKELDVRDSELMTEHIFEIKYSDPAEIVSTIEIVLGSQAKTAAAGTAAGTGQTSSAAQTQSMQYDSFGGGRNQSGRNQSGFTQMSGRTQTGRTATGSQSFSSVVISGTTTPIRMIPVAKQRWIIVRANKEDMKRVAEWIDKLDRAEIPSPQQSVVSIIYADVQEVVSMINMALKDVPPVGGKPPVVVQPLETSKQIVIFGTEEGRTMVEKMIAKIDMPSGDFFTEKTFKLKYADPDQIKTNIDGLYSNTSTTSAASSTARLRGMMDLGGSSSDPKDAVKVISYPTMKQVTIIASEKNMEKIAKQIELEWDKPMDIENDQYRILTLNNSDPVQLAELLNKLFSGTSTSSSSSSSSNSMMQMLLGSSGSTDSKQKIIGSLYGLLTFEPVPDTKKLIVISKIPEAYDVIEKLVNKLDGEEGGEIPQVVTLQYADCEALCDQLNAIFNEAGTPATLQRTNRGLSSYDAESQGGEVQGSNTSSSDTITPWWTRQSQSETELPPSNLIGKVRFVPVQRSKAVLVLAPAKYIPDLIKMVQALDKPGMQVMIKAVIVEIDMEDNSSLGVRLSSNPDALGDAGVNGGMFSNTLTNIQNTGGANTSTAGALLEGGQLNSSINLYAMVDLLVKKFNGRILTQPTLWTKDNEEAIFVKGRKIAFIEGDTTDTSNLSSSSKTYTYENVGVTLRIRPNITPEKAVDITINLNISELEDLKFVNDQNTRKNLDATTHMIVSDGQTIMLGGMLYQEDQTTKEKIPLLGDLPLLGYLFSYNASNLMNSELLVFITPHVFDEKMRQIFPQQEDHKEVVDKYVKQRDQVIEQLAEKIRERFSDPNQF